MRQAMTNNLRLLCRLWIAAATVAILFYAPVSVTYRYSGYSPKDDTVTETESIRPFGSARDSGSRMAVKSSLDFSRLIVVLLTMNFLPAVLLWRHDEVVVWLERQKRNSVTIDQSPKNEIVTRARAWREVLFSLCVVVVSGIGLLALGFFTDSKQHTSAESAVPQDAAVTKLETQTPPSSPATSQETPSPR